MVWVEKHTMDGMAFYVESETNDVSWHKPESLMTAEEKDDSKLKYVWVPSAEDVWQPGQWMKGGDGEDVEVKLENGETMIVPASREMKGPETRGMLMEVPLWELKKSNLRFLEDDLVMLDPVNEAFIIHNLHKRYEKRQIYTWVGAARSVLVSVNPYQNLDLYGEDQIVLHREKPANVPIPPHVFDLANDSYDSMAFERTDQSILISGESGAGKTEATKQCLQYLAAIAGSDSNVEEKVLVANPLLEAFGNAKTIRNINSSRFGKWMEVYFDRRTTKMKGSRIFNYLLERSRVVHQQKDERNYHIFYQLCMNPNSKSNYNLLDPEQYNYMNQSGCIKVPQIDDSKEFADVLDAMQKLEFTDEEQASILQLTAAVLWLGNVEFDKLMLKDGVEGSKIKDGPAVQEVAKYLELDLDTMSKILCFRTIRPKAGLDAAVIPLKKKDARAACDSLAMGIYGKLFNWMVTRVNDSLGEPEGRFIGILDIFGFEIFDNNSFEQLCINYANEKLQQLFNKTTFKEEEELYKAEGIDYSPIHFLDNQQVLDMVESKPYGILPILDDECLIPEGNDQKFMNKIEDHHGARDVFMTDKKRRFNNALSFEIKHYAGVVKYDASLFMIKNVDTVYDDMYGAMAKSGNDLLKTIFNDADKRIKTLSYQFRGQLSKLMDTLYTTESRFIRCIKPNDNLSPNQFVATSCAEQLRYSGVFEAVNIRKTGYPFRFTHKRFAYRFSCINQGYSYKSKIVGEDYTARVKEILRVAKPDFSGVKIGKTMCLYKANEYKLLKLLRNMALEVLIPKSQSLIRGGLAMHYFSVLMKNTANIEKFIKKADDLEGLTKAIDAAAPEKNFNRLQLRLFNFEPRNLKIAERLKKDLEDWVDIETKMKDLVEISEKGKPDPYYERLKVIDGKVEQTLKRQRDQERSAKVDFYGHKAYVKPKLTRSQKDLHKRIKELIHLCILGQLDARVAKAMAAFDREGMIAALEEADGLRHVTDDIRKARDLLGKMEDLDMEAQRAVACVSKPMLKSVAKHARELKQSNEYITKVQNLLQLDEKSFVEAEYERAKEVGDDTRRIHREIKLMEFKYNEADIKAYTLDKLANYRTSEDFANSTFASRVFGIGKQQLIEGMKEHSAKPIPTSLTLSPPEMLGEEVPATAKAEVKLFKKHSVAYFKSLLQIMGDKKSPDVDAAKSAILEAGLQAYRDSDESTLMELYCQILKQCTKNPNKESQSKGMAFLASMLSVFPPSTASYNPDPREKPTFDDAVVMWILNEVMEGDRKKFVSALHNTKYSGPSNTTPVPNMLERHFAELTGKYSLDGEADSGPEESMKSKYLEGL